MRENIKKAGMPRHYPHSLISNHLNTNPVPQLKTWPAVDLLNPTDQNSIIISLHQGPPTGGQGPQLQFHVHKPQDVACETPNQSAACHETVPFMPFCVLHTYLIAQRNVISFYFLSNVTIGHFAWANRVDSHRATYYIYATQVDTLEACQIFNLRGGNPLSWWPIHVDTPGYPMNPYDIPW